MIHIVVTMIVKSSRLPDFLAECEKLRPLVLAEPGCIEYVYTRDIASPLSIQEPLHANRITLIEKWNSLAALQVHMEQAHMKEFGPSFLGVLIMRLDPPYMHEQCELKGCVQLLNGVEK